MWNMIHPIVATMEPSALSPGTLLAVLVFIVIIVALMPHSEE